MQLLDSQARQIEDMEGLLVERSENTSNCTQAPQLGHQDTTIAPSEGEPVRMAAFSEQDSCERQQRQQRMEEELRLVGLQLEALAQENAWLKVRYQLCFPTVTVPVQIPTYT